MKTKEKITNEALTLFSVKGYKGTSVKDIAAAVGIKDASLYKHYRSKQEILDSIVQMVQEHMNTITESLGIPVGANLKETVSLYVQFTEQDFVDVSKKIFLFYLNDSVLSRFWKMGSMEQYHDEGVSSVFKKLFMEDSIAYQTALFAELIEQKIIKEEDPELLAMSFYGPFFFLLSKYATTQGRDEEMLATLEKQVRAFFRLTMVR